MMLSFDHLWLRIPKVHCRSSLWTDDERERERERKSIHRASSHICEQPVGHRSRVTDWIYLVNEIEKYSLHFNRDLLNIASI